jgi:hypothetical protein
MEEEMFRTETDGGNLHRAPGGFAGKCPRRAVTRVTVLSAILLLSVVSRGQTPYGGGSGTQGDPYLIRTAQDLCDLSHTPDDWSKHFRLTADIDLSKIPPETVGVIGGEEAAFTGTFDGSDKTIKNLIRICPACSDVGLFGYARSGAEVRNLHLVDSTVRALEGENVGGLVGRLKRGAIINCSVTRATVTGSVAVGGLVGWNEGTITACSVTGVVEGNHSAGGLVGLHGWDGVIRNCRTETHVLGTGPVGGLVGSGVMCEIHWCCATGYVTGQHDVAGLLGRNGGGIVANCYSAASVSGSSVTGGLVGHNAPSCDCSAGYRVGEVRMCYAIGPVLGHSDSGGLVGLNEEACVVDASFWDVETSGVGHSDGGTGLTTAELQTPQRFTDAHWWFTPTPTGSFWVMRPGSGYPRPGWQFVVGDADNDGDVDMRDLGALARLWGQADSTFWLGGTDLTGDGIVDARDLRVLCDRWLADSDPASSGPSEPGPPPE